jgi:3-oxoacyl-(acyl-carrier-protein) synthase III
VIPTRILGASSLLPGRPVTTDEICRLAYPGRDPEKLRARTGIDTRYWADSDSTHASLGAAALQVALARANLRAADLERIVHVCCTGGDFLLPATANAIAAELDLHGSCDCVDLNNACAGFLTAFDMLARGVATGLQPVAVVVTELFSRHLDPSEPRPYVVFGDAAAAVVLGAGAPDEGLVASYCRNDGALRGSVRLEHAGLTRRPEFVRFGASNDQIAGEATDAMCDAIAEALRRAELTIDRIDWVLPHQPNGVMLDLVVERLGVPRERLVPIVSEVGSVGAASVPVSLDRLLQSGRVKPGQRILLAAVGAGIGYGALVYQVGATPPGAERLPGSI